MDRGEVIMEKTLAIIKPDATERNLIGDIIKMIEMNNFKLKRINSVNIYQTGNMNSFLFFN